MTGNYPVLAENLFSSGLIINSLKTEMAMEVQIV
jgi:hypothetical protein